MPDRIIKINELIREQLGWLINKEIELPPGVIITITKVATAKDLRQANIYVSILPDVKTFQVMKILIINARHLQNLLNEKIVLRNIPKLKFYLDDEERKAIEIDELLDNLK
ncbi:ribosome-binding factor A [Candidatus Falkowbacteria bacterium]|nr:ribosome-binding factor A [Candidatus Falkowbacteria bacterium]